MIRAVAQAVGDVGHAICNGNGTGCSCRDGELCEWVIPQALGAIAALGWARAPAAPPDESGLFAENQRLRAALDAIEMAAQKALDV